MPNSTSRTPGSAAAWALGLFASRKLVALVEGRLDLTRHPEGGTEAVLYVPDLRLDQPLAQAI